MYVTIAGINILSKRLVEKLEGKHDVVVVEEDEDKCKRLYASTGAKVINKSPTTISALEDAGITEADIMISTLKDENQNMVVCSLAKKFGVPKVVTRIEDDEYFDAFELIDAQAIGHTDLLLAEFLSAVEHPFLVKLANVSDNRELLKASIGQQSDLIGEQASEIRNLRKFPQEFKLTSVVKPEETLTGQLDVEIESGDEIILIGPSEEKNQLNKFFQNKN
jgi:trk system potassium uptake protein TrkA